MTKRVFQKTIVHLTILSEDEIEATTLDEITEKVSNLEWSASVKIDSRVKINGLEAASLVSKQGGDPVWFCLDDKGEDVGGCLSGEDDSDDSWAPEPPDEIDEDGVDEDSLNPPIEDE